MLLRQRTKEKDEQLIQLSKDKEELRSKLAALDDLVQHLLQEKGNSPTINIGKFLKILNFFIFYYLFLKYLLNLILDIAKRVDNTIASPGEMDGAENTAGKIRALITEIGSTNLVSSHSVAFEHCSCCSGRLITI